MSNGLDRYITCHLPIVGSKSTAGDGILNTLHRCMYLLLIRDISLGLAHGRGLCPWPQEALVASDVPPPEWPPLISSVSFT
jgi:hypothetical protein